MATQSSDASGVVETMWPDSYVPAHRWDPVSGLHSTWDESGTLLAEVPYVQADFDAWVAAREAANATASVVARQIESGLSQDLADLTAFIALDNTVVNNQPVGPYLKLIARVVRRLVRHALNRFDSAN